MSITATFAPNPHPAALERAIRIVENAWAEAQDGEHLAALLDRATSNDPHMRTGTMRAVTHEARKRIRAQQAALEA